MSNFRDLFTVCSAQASGDDWAEFVRTFGRSIRSTIRRALWELGYAYQHADILDLEQEVYCRLLQRASGGPALSDGGERRARVYVSRVVLAVIIDRERRAISDKRQSAGLSSHGTAALDCHEGTEVDPEARLLIAERVAWVVKRCCEVAGKRNRRVKVHALYLVVLGGYATRAASAALGGRITPSHIDTLVSRLRRHMAANGYALSRRNAAKQSRAPMAGGGGDSCLARAA